MAAFRMVLAHLVTVVAGVKSQVFVVRHCVRATTHDGDIAQYSGIPMPQWDVPVNWCTERGVQIIEKTGEALVKDWGLDPRTVRVFSDNVMRDGLTATSLLKGLGLQQAPVYFDAALFSTTKPAYGTALCEMPKRNLTIVERKRRFAEVPVPWDFQAALQELQDIIGVGAAGPLTDLGGLELDANGKPSGPARVLKLFGQLMLYAYASGIPYSNATDNQINKFVAWQHWYRSVTQWTSNRAVDNAHLLRSLLTNLAKPGYTDIYVGHDSNLDGLAAILELVWDAPPYMGGSLQPTPPGSGLWFEYDHDDDMIMVSYFYRAFNVTEDGFSLRRSEIKSWGSLQNFVSFAMSRLQSFDGALACFNKGMDQAACSSHPECVRLSLDGQCCPAPDGGMSVCCTDVVARMGCPCVNGRCCLTADDSTLACCNESSPLI